MAAKVGGFGVQEETRRVEPAGFLRNTLARLWGLSAIAPIIAVGG